MSGSDQRPSLTDAHEELEESIEELKRERQRLLRVLKYKRESGSSGRPASGSSPLSAKRKKRLGGTRGVQSALDEREHASNVSAGETTHGTVIVHDTSHDTFTTGPSGTPANTAGGSGGMASGSRDAGRDILSTEEEEEDPTHATADTSMHNPLTLSQIADTMGSPTSHVQFSESTRHDDSGHVTEGHTDGHGDNHQYERLVQRVEAQDGLIKLLKAQNEELQQERDYSHAQVSDELEDQKSQVQQLTLTVEQLIQKYVTVSMELVATKKAQGAAEQKAADHAKNTDTLREMFLEGIPSEKARKRDATEQAFWSKMATDEVLQESQPPVNFCDIDAFPQHFRTQLEDTRNQLRQSQNDVKTLSRKAQELDESNTQLRKDYKRQKVLVGKHRKELLGAVRRIYFMLAKQKKADSEMAFKDKYIHKIESKLLDTHKQVQQLRRRERNWRRDVQQAQAKSLSEVPEGKGIFSYWGGESDNGHGGGDDGAPQGHYRHASTGHSDPQRRAAQMIENDQNTPPMNTSVPLTREHIRNQLRQEIGVVNLQQQQGGNGAMHLEDEPGLTERESAFMQSVEEDLEVNDIEGFTERLQQLAYRYYDSPAKKRGVHA